MTKQRGLESLRACQKNRYEDGLDTAKSDVSADVLRQIGCTQAAEILTEPTAEAQAAHCRRRRLLRTVWALTAIVLMVSSNQSAEGKGLGRKQYRPNAKAACTLKLKCRLLFHIADKCSNASAK